MTSVYPFRCPAAPANVGASLMARVEGDDAAAITQADIESGSYVVYDLEGGTAAEAVAIVVADVIFNALQTDARWEEDDTGYNVLLSLPGAARPTGGRTCRIALTLVPEEGENIQVWWDIPTLDPDGSP